MKLLPGWSERIARKKEEKREKSFGYSLPKDPGYYWQQINFVQKVKQAKSMLEFATQRPLSHVGIDTEFKYDSPGVQINKRNIAYDPHSIHPLLLSIALSEPPEKTKGILYPFVIDLSRPELLPFLQHLFRLPVPFVGHFLKVELFCLFKLGIAIPKIVWDTWACEKALNLGRNHKKYKLSTGADDADKAKAKEETEEVESFSYSLISTCQRYGVAYAFAAEKDRLQRSFLRHIDNTNFSEEQLRYAAEDALATAKLYPLQLKATAENGILNHLITIEMPWAVTNADIEWKGIRVSSKKCEQVLKVCKSNLQNLERLLTEQGINYIRSHKELETFFTNANLRHLFYRNGKLTFDKRQLRLAKGQHPAVDLIRTARRLFDIKEEKLLSSELVGSDGRIHPENRQLGTHTGRQTSRWPNILGLDGLLRPCVVPEPGNGIGEVDLSQIEVGIAGAVYDDSKLVRMFNTGDVYSAMAQLFYRGNLSKQDLNLDSTEFKAKHRNLRESMKSCTLGIIYGITARGLAQQLNTNEMEAKALQKRFVEMFPALTEAQKKTIAAGEIRSYAVAIGGLRRYRLNTGLMSNWERNWMINFPVQGSAAVIFKAAGNRLNRLFHNYNAWLIVPLHDSYVFETPLDALEEVADLTRRVLIETVKEYFPELKPKVEVNIQSPDCWNKDGNTDPVDKINELVSQFI